MSRSVNPGPMTLFRGVFPNTYGAAGVPVGSVKADLLTHCAVVFGPLFGSPLTFGRSILFPFTVPIFATSMPVAVPRLIVNGAPLWTVKFPLARQPPAVRCSQPFDLPAKG